MSKKIVIIGAGEIGLSLGRILRSKNYQLKFWDKNPQILASLGGDQLGLPEIVPEAEILFMCVPSWALREATLFVSPYLSKHTLVVSLSKGIEPGTLKMADEILSSLLPSRQPFCLLSGPMISEELGEGGFGLGVVAGNSKAADGLKDIFSDTNLSISFSTDLHGVAVAGVLKNVYALFLGLVQGLNLGDNARGIILVKALAEMKKILALLGGRQETALTAAGLGDLVATGFSSYSKNHEAGKELAVGRISQPSGEGMNSLSSLVILLGDKYKKFPLLSSLYDITQGNIEAGPSLQKILFDAK